MDSSTLRATAKPATAQLAHYQLGDCLGRGAFGSVYRGLNWMTGETVAVKQIQLGNIPKQELGEIMSEIDLLKNLKHPNIVKYKGSEKTKEFLYIILEYCENGSLQHICKRFGKFPEGLVGVYTSQVLEGLQYLHDQGVIHRDIKGANILTNKDGSVKLADFGVATRTGAMNDFAVVGSPYWMAPEVIDQSGATTASDIWSVGCVVIELLEGKPPYHFLDPMPALFRIVQDDCPPLPEGASPVVKDFLLHCFQKDSNLRVSARKLLKHAWMVSSRRQLNQLRTGGSLRGSKASAIAGTAHDEAVKSVQEWNEALKEPARPAPRLIDPAASRAPPPATARRTSNPLYMAVPPNGDTSSPSASHNHRTPTRKTSRARPSAPIILEDSAGEAIANSVSPSQDQVSSPTDATTSPLSLSSNKPSLAAQPLLPLPLQVQPRVLSGSAPQLANVQHSEQQTDNWDADFEEDITTYKIAKLERSTDDDGVNLVDSKSGEEAKKAALPREHKVTGIPNDRSAKTTKTFATTPTTIPSPGSTSLDGDVDEFNDDTRTIRPQRSHLSPRRPDIALSKQPPSTKLASEIASNTEVDEMRPTSSPTIAPTPTRSTPFTSVNPNVKVMSTSASSSRITSVEDYSDLVSRDEEPHLDERVRHLKQQNSLGRRLFHPNDLKKLRDKSRSPVYSGEPTKTPSILTSPGRRTRDLHADRPSHERRKSASSQSGSSSPNFASPPSSRTNSLKLEAHALEKERWQQTRKSLGKYSEGMEEDYSDVFGSGNDDVAGKFDGLISASTSPHVVGMGLDDVDEFGDPKSATLSLTRRLSSRSWLGDDIEGEEDDPFAEIDAELEEFEDIETNLARDKHARLCGLIVELVETLKPESAVEALIEACDQLDEILYSMPDMKGHVLSSHGALAVIQLLEATRAREVISRLLGILNVIIYQDQAAQENLCLIGAIPVVMTFTAKRFAHDIRLEAAHFVFSMCSTSSLTLQFVLSCRGLKTLVDLIDEDYYEQKDLVWLGIACVNSVLELQSPASRNDFCRMLAQEGLLEPLSTALLCVIQDQDADNVDSAEAQILHTFLIFSQSEPWLKQKVATRGTLRRMLQACPFLEPDSLTLMLKVVKNLSMSPPLLDELQNCNTIEILTRILAEHYDGEYGAEMSNQILTTMYNLCRLNKTRQEEAAQAGIIPQLLRIARTSSPLKQFALPILCDFAHAGKPTRKLFWQHSGLDFYLELLGDPYWQISALESVLVWMQDETARVEDVLVQRASVRALVKLFTSAKANTFETLLEPFLKLCRLSSNLMLAIARYSEFFQRLRDRLEYNRAVVRLNLLRIVKAVCDVHPDPAKAVEQNGLVKIIEKLSQSDNAILVRELAREVTAQIQAGPTAAASSSALNVPIRTVRRAASETNVGTVPVSTSIKATSSADGARTRRPVLAPVSSRGTSLLELGEPATAEQKPWPARTVISPSHYPNQIEGSSTSTARRPSALHIFGDQRPTPSATENGRKHTAP